MGAERGDAVTVEYKGRYESGQLFDSTENKGPLSFIIGEKRVLKGFEEALIGMQPGEEKTVRLQPKDAFGERKEEYVQSVPRDAVETKARIFIGNRIALQLPGTDRTFFARIVAFDEKSVTLDLNPEMAGKTVVFEMKLLAIKGKG